MKRFGYVILAIVFTVGFFFVSVSFAANPPSKYYVDQSKLPFDPLANTETVRYWGIHSGAGYRIEVPINWNGRLVVYCHGYRSGSELTVTNPSIRQYLINNGFAWAASSYRANGYDVKAGVIDTHALVKFFNGLVGKPDRTYLMGHSMGGHIIGVAIEQYPKTFDGALPMCGVMGDCEQFDYFLDYQVIAQWLTDTIVEFPFPSDYSDTIVPAMKDKLGGDSGFPFSLSEAGLKLKTATEYISGGERPLFSEAFVSWANFLFTMGLDGTLGGITPGNVMGNIGVIYQLDGDPELSQEEEDLNAEVLRIAPDRQGRHPNGLANVPAISGNIAVPVLALHNVGDLYVPLLNEQVYAKRVAARGKSHLLVQRVIRDIGHCYFTPYEQEQALSDLVNWVENGVKPLGDDVLDPSVVADSKFGCNFTYPIRLFDLSGCN